MRNIDKIKAAAIAVHAILAISFLANVASAEGSSMFAAPNSATALEYKYFDGGKSFIYCLRAYDVPSKSFVDKQFCIRKNKGADYVFLDVDKNIKNVDAPEVVIRYNTLDHGLVDKAYKVAPGQYGDKSVFIVGPEDRIDVVDMLLKSKDVILFYQPNDSDQYSFMYYPLPKRGVDGKLPMVEAK